MKKKGFTLIELLAVIVVISIIGLITVPAVSNYIIKSKKASYKISVQTTMEAAKEYVGKYEENNDFPESGIDITQIDLNLKGNKFKNGIIKKNEFGEIEAVNVYDGEYCANGTKQNLVVEKVGSLEECNKVDASKPDLKIKVVNIGSTKINVTAIAVDNQSGIKDYKYCIGDECSDYIKENNYEFKNLTNGTEYEITVIVRNNNYGKGEQYTEEVTTNTKKIKVKTNKVNTPEFKISSSSYATSKEITIIYPTVEGYEKSYEIIDEEGNLIEKKEVTETELTIIVNKNGVLKASVTNSEETISNELIIRGIDEDAPEVYVIMSDTWERPKQIEVIVKENGSGLASKAYSYNGGKSWINNKKKSFQENTTIKLLVRDKLNNQTTSYKICTEKDKEGNPINCGELVDEIKVSKIDTVKPTCSLKVTSGLLGIENWYRSDVTIEFENIDDKAIDPSDETKLIEGSGVVESYIDKATLTEEGKYKVTGTVVDKLGNTGTCEIEVNVDKTKPTCGTMNIIGEAGVEGWYHSDVIISKIDGTDNLSGHYTTILNYTSLTNETTGTVVRLTTTDKAGNICTSEKTVKIDKTAPTCGTYTISGTKGLNGWYKSDVEITNTEGTDELSGHYTTILNYNSIDTETKGTNITLTTTDKAGNTCIVGETLKIDKTPPTLEFILNGNKVGSGYQSGLQVTTKCTDSISPIVSGNASIKLTSKGWHTVSGTCVNEAGYSVSDSNSYLIYINTKDSSCGYASCESSACGIKETIYNSCKNSNCTCSLYGCTLYKSCPYDCSHTSQSGCISHASSTGGSCATDQGGEWVHTYNTRRAACGSEYVTGNSTCANANSKVCDTYNSCRNSSCGVDYYNYYSCKDSSCGYATCWHT